MPLVELNGIHINYEEHGSHYGTPILLTHAYAGPNTPCKQPGNEEDFYFPYCGVKHYFRAFIINAAEHIIGWTQSSVEMVERNYLPIKRCAIDMHVERRQKNRNQCPLLAYISE